VNAAPAASFTSETSGLQVAFKSTSTDDGAIARYAWDFGDGTSFDPTSNPTHTYKVAGNYLVTLTVTDNGTPALTNAVSTLIKVSAAGLPPVAVVSVDPGPVVDEATTVILDGSGSTGDAPLTHEWIQNPDDGAKVVLVRRGASATFKAPKVGLTGLDLHFTLIVTDGKGLKSQAEVTITVKNSAAANVKPVADAGPGIHVEQGSEATLNGGNSSDEDGDDTIIRYIWTQNPGDEIRVILTNDQATPTATFIAPAAPKNVYILRFELVVEDNEGAVSEPAPVVVNVVLGDGAALPVADAGSDQTVAPGAIVQLDGSASKGREGATADSSGLIAYRWVSNNSEVIFSDSTLVNPTLIVPTDMATGSQLLVTLQVTNTDGLIASDEIVISVGENPPEVEAGELQVVAKGSTVTLAGTASDNGSIESRLWAQLEGIPVELIDPSSEDGKTTFFAPKIEGDSATLRFEFQATDNENLKSSDAVEITVKEGANFTGSSGGGLGLWSLIGLGFLFRLRKAEW
jgi:PKD repeat protein